MVGWLQWLLDGPAFDQAPGFGDGQRSVVCCSPWGHKELDMTERLNWTELNFFIAQLSQPYVTNSKAIALNIWTFFSRVMSLLFNMLSRFVLTFLTRGNCLLISWLQSPSTVISEPKKMIKFHYFYLFPFHLPWINGVGCHDLCFFFLISSLKQALSSFTLIKWFFSSS